MKKTIYLLIIVSFVFSLAAIPVTNVAEANEASSSGNTAVSPASNITNSSKLEKILSPEHIKYFQVIKKEGNVLFGIRKGTTTAPVGNTTAVSVASSSKLEKISAPAFINLFEKIQKIGTALWGIKKKATSTPSAPFIIAPEISTCVATAIDVKDKALMARVTAAATELNAALSTRSACQQAAVIATTTPREILNACVKTFNEARKTIREASKKVQTEAWSTYKESLKACGTAATNTSSVPMIEDGESLFD